MTASGGGGGWVLLCCAGHSSTAASERVFVPRDPCLCWILRSFGGGVPSHFLQGPLTCPPLPFYPRSPGGLSKEWLVWEKVEGHWAHCDSVGPLPRQGKFEGSYTASLLGGVRLLLASHHSGDLASAKTRSLSLCLLTPPV